MDMYHHTEYLYILITYFRQFCIILELRIYLIEQKVNSVHILYSEAVLVFQASFLFERLIK